MVANRSPLAQGVCLHPHFAIFIDVLHYIYYRYQVLFCRRDDSAVTQQHEQASTTYLVIQQGPQAGKRIEIWKERTTIGRSRDCDIFLEDITVHRKQASIVLGAAGYVLLDDHGSGDSFVNGRPIKEQLLTDGDQLLFGNTQLTFFSQAAVTRPIQFSSSR